MNGVPKPAFYRYNSLCLTGTPEISRLTYHHRHRHSACEIQVFLWSFGFPLCRQKEIRFLREIVT